MKLHLIRGTNDSSFDEQLQKETILSTIKKYFGLYGYNPLETPILEPYEVLASKYAGGAEILKETYSLYDQGDRHIALRYDLTVPFARFIGMNPHLKQPIKRYEIGKSFRDGPVKAGRKREFTQCDCDCVGVKQMTVDAEQIMMALGIFDTLGLDTQIEVNNRKLLSGVIRHCNIPHENISSAILALDKMKKIAHNDLVQELETAGLTEVQITTLLDTIGMLNTIKEKFYDKTTERDAFFKELRSISDQEIYQEGVDELEELLNYLISYHGDDSVIYSRIALNFGLARGLEIYTSTVFEGFLTSGSITSSLCGGGRWDEIIGKFLETQQQYPAVGISFGLDVIYEALREKAGDSRSTSLSVYIIPIKEKHNVLSLVSSLRQQGIACDLDQMNRNLSKNLDYADKMGIPYVIIAGPKEFAEGKYKLRDMTTGNEELLREDELVSTLAQKE